MTVHVRLRERLQRLLVLPGAKKLIPFFDIPRKWIAPRKAHQTP